GWEKDGGGEKGNVGGGPRLKKKKWMASEEPAHLRAVFLVQHRQGDIGESRAGFEQWLFFQAEYGIRFWSVTGVQTCALPISIHQLRGPLLRISQQKLEWIRAGLAGRALSVLPEHESGRGDRYRSHPHAEER